MAFYVVTTSLIRLVGEYLFTQKITGEMRTAEELAGAMAEPLAAYDAETLWQEVCDASERTGGRVLVLDLYGVVQADAYSQLNGTQLSRSEVAGVLNDGGDYYGYYASGSEWQSPLLSGLTGDMIGLYATAIRSGERMVGVLVFTTMVEDMYRSLVEIQTQMLMWLLLVAAAVAIMSLLLSRYFTRPITDLNAGIVRMTRGDLSARVRVKGRNEFAQLATAFNMMCERLESLDKSRNQFVSNASHELKTPLSTMKILIETLVYQDPMDPDMCREFLGDINKEIDRLNSIINDQLSLVSIDSGEANLAMKPVSLTDVLNENMRRLQPLARERGIEMSAAVIQGINVNGDIMKLTQVFYNLIDNAIKYTPRGGRVRVELLRRDKKAVVRVIDTGIGIPREDQKHIFERYYRVDKARSRETGGTGLGLSIVKQLVVLHGGDITVASEEEKGSTFTVELPALG